jgi:hypothetical protein
MQSNGKVEDFKNIGLTEKMILVKDIEKLWDRIGKFFSINNISKTDIETAIKQVRSENT